MAYCCIQLYSIPWYFTPVKSIHDHNIGSLCQSKETKSESNDRNFAYLIETLTANIGMVLPWALASMITKYSKDVMTMWIPKNWRQSSIHFQLLLNSFPGILYEQRGRATAPHRRCSCFSKSRFPNAYYVSREMAKHRTRTSSKQKLCWLFCHRLLF